MKLSFGTVRKIAAAFIVPAALFGAVAVGGVAHAQEIDCSANPLLCNGGLGLPQPPPLPGDDGNPVPGSTGEAVYLAASGGSIAGGGAVLQSCAACNGGEKVGFVGEGGTITFQPFAPTTGTFTVTIVYCDGSATGRQADMSVDGGAPQLVSFTPTGGWATIGALTVNVTLVHGYNTIEFSNPAAYAPDFSEIVVSN
jgi:hypothetical protein